MRLNRFYDVADKNSLHYIMVIKITYFIHGTAKDNERDLATGWSPGELSELGISQAKELAKLVSNKQTLLIYSRMRI